MEITDIIEILEENEEFGEWMEYNGSETIFCLEETNWRALHINGSPMRVYGDVIIDEDKETITIKTDDRFGFGMGTVVDITIKAEDIEDFEVGEE